MFESLLCSVVDFLNDVYSLKIAYSLVEVRATFISGYMNKFSNGIGKYACLMVVVCALPRSTSSLAPGTWLDFSYQA